MKIQDITLDDIKQKTIWRVVNANLESWLDWTIEKANRINPSVIIVHSAISVDDHKVYPTIVTKYYEDSGEVGEVGVHNGVAWVNMHEVVFEGVVSRPFLAHISNLDIHEYQKGIFDNKKWHYNRFNHYITQLGNENIVKYIEPDVGIPQYIIKGTIKENYSSVTKMIIECSGLRKSQKISRANKRMGQIIKIINFLKQNPNNHAMLESLLVSDNPEVVHMMQYQLADLFEETCLRLISQKSREDSIDGLGAKYWLKDYTTKKSISGT